MNTVLSCVHKYAKDVANAVKAVQSLRGYDIGGIYMLGGSTGGGVALIAASQLKDVKAVVANSPFIGSALFAKWYQKLGKPDNSLWKSWYQICLQVYGTDISSSAYTSRSVISHIGTIHSPVLLLQGTADKHVMWQPVQELADAMKKHGETVKLTLFKGAHHGLLSPPQVYNQSTDATQAWLTKYGFPEQYLTNTFF